MISKLILACFHARTAAHIFHLSTRSRSDHLALQTFYDEIVGMADRLAEAYQGEYSLLKFGREPYTLPSTAIEMLEDLRECVDNCSDKFDPSDTHLVAICDDIRELIGSVSYQLRFLK